MTIGPLGGDEYANRKAFSMLRDLKEKLAADHPTYRELSMGMSGDFEEAIKEGGYHGQNRLPPFRQQILKYSGGKRMNTLGILGCGNMGSALAMAAAAESPNTSLFLYDIDPEKSSALAETTGGTVSGSIRSLMEQSEAILVALKPGTLPKVMRDNRCSDKLLISIAAGLSLKTLEASCPDSRWIRVMPNTPVLVNRGVLGWTAGSGITDEDRDFFTSVFSSSGQLFETGENLLDTVTGLSGSGPAYVFLIINALAEGAVLEGMPKNMALKIAAETVAGAAEMVAASGEHPEVLKDRVTSPGGTTAAGLAILENAGVRGSLIETVRSAVQRSRELGG